MQVAHLILHIAPDDIFIRFVQGLFNEALPGQNLWRIHGCKSLPVFAELSESSRLVSGGYFNSEDLTNDLKHADCIIFHSLPLSPGQIRGVLKLVPDNLPIIWRGWGFDYYNYLEAAGLNMYLPETELLLKEIRSRRYGRLHTLQKLRLSIESWKLGYKRKHLIPRIDYFSCCVPNDYVSLRNAMPQFAAEFLPLNYYSVEDVFLKGCTADCLRGGRNILLGNSSTASNNHIEVFRLLGRADLNERRVIVPLNYGDMRYKPKVIVVGNRILGDRFFPITEFMNLTDYNGVVSSCDIVIMNHVRQQAIGNICASLLRGAKVFLRPENPIYSYLTSMGAVLFPISDRLADDINDAVLSESAVDVNRQVMQKMWLRDVAIDQVAAIPKIIAAEKQFRDKM